MKFHRKTSLDTSNISSTNTTVTSTSYAISDDSSETNGIKNASKTSTEKNFSISEYTWVPSGSQTLVEKYMMSLPESDRPIGGTEGAQIRRQRLAQQVSIVETPFLSFLEYEKNLGITYRTGPTVNI